jgi:HAD superfamily hydrolase (TIGR01509 family)
MLFLIDLDGTLIDSDHFHCEAWGRVLNMNPTEIDHIIKGEGMENYLSRENFKELKTQKFEEMLKIEEISYIQNAEMFIDFIHEYDIKHAVVTHTDRKIVNHFKTKAPHLNKLENWVVRDDYINPKPHPECYKLAIKRYGNGCEDIIGFENTMHGLKSIKHVTNNTIKISRDTDYANVIRHIKTRFPKKFNNIQACAHKTLLKNI